MDKKLINYLKSIKKKPMEDDMETGAETSRAENIKTAEKIGREAITVENLSKKTPEEAERMVGWSHPLNPELQGLEKMLLDYRKKGKK